MKIDSIEPEIIFDSRHEHTISVTLSSGKVKSSASVPCGKSKGAAEEFCQSPERSYQIIEEISAKLRQKSFGNQVDFDQFLLDLDGTERKTNFGVEVTLSLSFAFARIFALSNQVELYQVLGELAQTKPRNFPRLFFNLVNGGLHVDKELNPLPFQEYLLIPQTTQPKKATNLAFTFLDRLKGVLKNSRKVIHYGNEGGFVVSGDDPETGLKIFHQLLNSNQNFGEVNFGIDAAASSLWQNDVYQWRSKSWKKEGLANIYKEITAVYPILSIEDPFQQEAWDDWSELTRDLGEKIWIIGDDLTVTNVKRIEKAHEKNSVNAVLIKPDQIGTVWETVQAIQKAKEYGWKIIVSHRSGETMDSFIADLAFGVGADGLKAGSPLQTERLAKYNRLIEIESSRQTGVVG